MIREWTSMITITTDNEIEFWVNTNWRITYGIITVDDFGGYFVNTEDGDLYHVATIIEAKRVVVDKSKEKSDVPSYIDNSLWEDWEALDVE